MEDKNEQKVLIVEQMLRDVLDVLELPMNNSTEGTAHRIAKMWVNETLPHINNNGIEELNKKMKVFDNVDDLHDLVIVKDIPFYSTCEHHFMPFFGKIAVGYVPNDKIIGLSKIPRVVEWFSKKPQLQERLVKEIGDYLIEHIQPKCIYVMAYDTTHTCVLCRGVESEADTETMYGLSASNITLEASRTQRREFLDRIRR